MTEANPETKPAGTAAPNRLMATLKGFYAALKRLPRMEFLIALIACHILGGWLAQCIRAADARLLVNQWFPLLSFIGAFVVALVLILKAFTIRPLSPTIERRVIAVACVFPGIGLMMKMTATPSVLLTEGGSLLIACVGIAVFWRKNTTATETHA